MTELGIYGGTFSPPHIGHIRAAHAFLEQVKPDKLMIIPTYISPHKTYTSANGGEDGEIRLEMLKIAFDTDENGKRGVIEVSSCEIQEKRPSYTVYTLRRFTSPDTRITFLCGTDMFLTLDSWFRAPVIFELATICYVRRECDSVNDLAIEQKTEEYKSRFGAKIIPVKTAVKEISSSELREALKNRADVSDFLPKSVYDYIVEKSLYL